MRHDSENSPSFEPLPLSSSITNILSSAYIYDYAKTNKLEIGKLGPGIPTDELIQKIQQSLLTIMTSKNPNCCGNKEYTCRCSIVMVYVGVCCDCRNIRNIKQYSSTYLPQMNVKDVIILCFYLQHS